MKPRGFTLIELMIVIAIIAIIVAIAIPGLVRVRISSNERSASTSLKALLAAEENFKGNDLDRNGANDYWTGDLAGLFCITIEATQRPIAAISDQGMAYADTYRYDDAGGTFQGLDYDGDGVPDTTYNPLVLGGARSPKSGYFYQAMLLDELGNTYFIDTDGQGLCHNYGQFAFCSIPSSWDNTGQYIFIINQVGSAFRRDFGLATVTPVLGTQTPTFNGTDALNWPDAVALSSFGKVE